MPRGPAPHNLRFWGIAPKFQRGTVYAAELSSGVVKVGFSRYPRKRMIQLVHDIRRDFGANLVRFHIGPDLIDRSPYSVEMQLIELAASIGTQLPGRREYFERLSFDAAVALIAGLCASVPARAA